MGNYSIGNFPSTATSTVDRAGRTAVLPDRDTVGSRRACA
jgi:hypothetical protein